MHHVELAWALAESADHWLDGSKRFEVYLALGAGDTCAAIRDLTQVVVREGVNLSAEVLVSLGAWWAAHPGRNQHQMAVLVNQLRTLR